MNVSATVEELKAVLREGRERLAELHERIARLDGSLIRLQDARHGFGLHRTALRRRLGRPNLTAGEERQLLSLIAHTWTTLGAIKTASRDIQQCRGEAWDQLLQLQDSLADCEAMLEGRSPPKVRMRA